MKKSTAKPMLAATLLVAALFTAGIAIHGCGSESYDTSGLNSNDPSAISCSSTTGAASSLLINNGNASTQSSNVKLSFHAEDPDGVAAYFVSETATAPAASAAEWVPVAVTCTSLDGTGISFKVEDAWVSGTFARTVYIWFKDGAGNVSASTSDNINLIIPATGC